jgi:hypothetical protein
MTKGCDPDELSMSGYSTRPDVRIGFVPSACASFMSRPIRATIHTEALRHNLARARALVPDAKLWAVPTALRCWIWTRPNACATWAGAAPFC